MKKNFSSILAISFAILLGACKQVAMETNAEATPTALLQSYDGVVYPNSKGYTPKFLTKSASADQGDWETWKYGYLSDGTATANPWVTDTTINTPIGNTPLLQDIKKVNGWRLLVGKYEHTGINTPAYYVFQNIYTGVLKVYYYVELFAPNNTCFWTLTFKSLDGKPQKMLALYESTPEPLNRITTTEAKINISNYTPDESKGLGTGWNCIIANLAYDPSFDNSSLSINAWNNNTLEVILQGVVNLYSRGTIISRQSSNRVQGTVDGLLTTLSPSVTDYIENWLNPPKKDEETKAVSIAAAAAGWVVKSGLSMLSKLFTGRFTKTTEVKQDISMTTTGSINFSGTITSPSPAPMQAITIPYFNKNNVGELGVWNLTESPIIYVNPLADYVPGSPYEGGGEFDYKIRGDYRVAYNIAMNPQTSSNIIKSWSEAQAYIDTTAVKFNAPGFNFGNAGQGGYVNSFYDSEMKGSSIYNNVFEPNFSTTCLVYSLYPNSFHQILPKGYTPIAFSTPPAVINISNERAHGFNGYRGDRYRVSIVNYLVVNNAIGTQDTIVSSRQYTPKVEWDN